MAVLLVIVHARYITEHVFAMECKSVLYMSLCCSEFRVCFVYIQKHVQKAYNVHRIF